MLPSDALAFNLSNGDYAAKWIPLHWAVTHGLPGFTGATPVIPIRIDSPAAAFSIRFRQESLFTCPGIRTVISTGYVYTGPLADDRPG